MTDSTTWQQIVAASLLGTERDFLPPHDTNADVQELLSQSEEANSAKSLLQAAAIVSLYNRAGQRPPKTDETLALCEEETQNVCSPQSRAHLQTLLGGTFAEFLPEWLQAASEQKLRVPWEMLPELLNWAKGKTERERVRPLLGARGRWLAGQNAAWRDFAGTPNEEPETLWQTAPHHARLDVLKGLRTSDAKRARTLIQSTWDEENAETRADFLSVCEIGLTDEDEAWLETLLDDRSKVVRRIAADLLARLPDSRLVQRMIARVQPLVSFVAATANQMAQLEITPPNMPDGAMQRDGIETKRPAHLLQMGEKAWWLQQLLSKVPPSFWNQAAPEELIAIAKGHEWERVLVSSWAASAALSNDEKWARALLPGNNIDATSQPLLMTTLSPAQRDELFLQMLQSEGTIRYSTDETMALLLQSHHAWSRDLSLAVLQKWRERVQVSINDWQLAMQMREVSPYFSPELADEAARHWPEQNDKSHWKNAVDDFVARLQFRRDMRQALT